MYTVSHHQPNVLQAPRPIFRLSKDARSTYHFFTLKYPSSTCSLLKQNHKWNSSLKSSIPGSSKSLPAMGLLLIVLQSTNRNSIIFFIIFIAEIIIPSSTIVRFCASRGFPIALGHRVYSTIYEASASNKPDKPGHDLIFSLYVLLILP